MKLTRIHMGIKALPAAGLLVMALLCSCNKVNPDDSPKSIGFDQPETKAAAPDNLQVDGSTFCVNAKFSSGSTFNDATATSVFGNQDVAWNGSDWTYSPLKFWSTSSTYRFRAFWPSGAATCTDDLSSAMTLTGFTVKSTCEEQTDLLVSDIIERNTDASGGTDVVNMQFHHVLCRVYLNIYNKDNQAGADVIEVTRVDLSGMKNKGTFTSSYNSTSSQWEESWDVSTGQNLSIQSENATTLGDIEHKTAFFENGLILIPHNVSNLVITVTYKVTHGGVTSAAKTINVSAGAQNWLPNKSYTYNLGMTENYSIVFGPPTVEDWVTTASESIYVK